MKIVKFTVVALFAALFAVGCGDGLSFNDGGGQQTSNKGFLSISQLNIDCRIDESDPEIGLNSAKPMATRTATDVEEFMCQIINSNGEIVREFKYGERPTEPIELMTGEYIFKIQSGEVPGVAWETPVYGAEKMFKIVRNETETIKEIVCSLMQIKVTVTFAPDLKERLAPETKTTVTIGSNSTVFSLAEGRAAFFHAPMVNNTIEVRVSGEYAADLVNFKTVNVSKEIKDVKVGQCSNILFYLEHAADGNIEVSVDLRDWITDEPVICNVADLITESEWTEGGNEGGNEGDTPAKEDPSIIWAGHDISKREQVVPGLDVDLIVESSAGIKEFIVKIISETLTASELANNNLCDTMNLCYPDQSLDSTTGTVIDVTEPLTALGFVVGDQVINKNYVKLSITTFMGVLSGVSGPDAKNHDFEITVTDNNGNTTVKTLMLKTGN